MDDRLRAGKPSRYVTRHLGQLSLTFLRGRWIASTSLSGWGWGGVCSLVSGGSLAGNTVWSHMASHTPYSVAVRWISINSYSPFANYYYYFGFILNQPNFLHLLRLWMNASKVNCKELLQQDFLQLGPAALPVSQSSTFKHCKVQVVTVT